MAEPNKNQTGNWILINGKVYVINYKVNIFDLLNFLQKNKLVLITEHNQKILSQQMSKRTLLNHLDRIEFVTIVGGG